MGGYKLLENTRIPKNLSTQKFGISMKIDIGRP